MKTFYSVCDKGNLRVYFSGKSGNRWTNRERYWWDTQLVHPCGCQDSDSFLLYLWPGKYCLCSCFLIRWRSSDRRVLGVTITMYKPGFPLATWIILCVILVLKLDHFILLEVYRKKSFYLSFLLSCRCSRHSCRKRKITLIRWWDHECHDFTVTGKN